MGALALLLLMGTGAVLFLAARNQAVSRTTVVAVGFTGLMWYAIPTIAYLILPWDRFAPTFNQEAYVELLALENAGLLATSLVLLRPRPYFSWLVDRSIARSAPSDRVILVTFVLAVTTSVIARVAANVIMGANYYERNAFQMVGSEEMKGLAGFISVAFTLTNAVGYACLIQPMKVPRFARAVALLGAVWVVYTVVDDLSNGARIAILVPVALVLMRSANSMKSTRAIVLSVGFAAVLTLAIGAVLTVAIGRSRGDEQLGASEMNSGSRELFRTSSLLEIGEVFLTDLTDKFNAPLGGLVLLQAEGESAAGWRPFAGAMLTLVPRLLMPDKPVPGSSNGQYSGHPSRIVAAYVGFDPDTGNAGLSVGAVARWELGSFGLVLLVVLGWVHLCLLNSMLVAKSLGYQVVGISLIGIPAFGSVVPTPDVAIQMFMRALAILGVLIGVRILTRPRGLKAAAS